MQKLAIHVGYFKQPEAEEATAAAAPVCEQVHILVRRLHQMLGHCGERATRKTGRYLGMKIA